MRFVSKGRILKPFPPPEIKANEGVLKAMNHIAKKDQTKLLQFFRRGVRHIVAQGTKSMRSPDDEFDSNQCSYHFPESDGTVLRCAIGGGLRMDVAEMLELKFLGEWITWEINPQKLERAVCRAIGISCNEPNIKFLGRFQECHDGAARTRFIKNFLGRVQDLADDYDIAFDKAQYA